MLNFRDFVSASGGITTSNIGYENILSESKIVMLDPSGRNVSKIWHKPRINSVESSDWSGYRPSIKQNLSEDQLVVSSNIGIPIIYNRNKYVVATEYKEKCSADLLEYFEREIISPAEDMIQEAMIEYEYVRGITDYSQITEFTDEFKYFCFDSLSKNKEKSLSDLKSSISNLSRDIRELREFLNFCKEREDANI